MKGMSNEDSGLFPKKYMDRPVKEESDIVERAAEMLRVVLNGDEVESIDVKYTKDKFDMSLNFKEK